MTLSDSPPLERAVENRGGGIFTKHLQKEPLWAESLPYREDSKEPGGVWLHNHCGRLEEGRNSILLTAQLLVASLRAELA